MRALWTGSLSFGLVNIPVRLYSGSLENNGLELTMLHKTDLSPIRYARICRKDGKEIAYEDIVKGYEYKKGDYVVLTDQDFQRANVKKTKTIEIIEFTKEAGIDSRYFEKPYLLEPDRGAAKAYALLRTALKKSGKVAICKFVLRQREHIGAIKPIGNLLVLDQMRYTNELRLPEGLDIPGALSNDKREVEVALKLIDQLTEPFIAEDYHDSYVAELEKVIAKKAKGQTVKVSGKEPAATDSKDLMAMLKASLEKSKASK